MTNNIVDADHRQCRDIDSLTGFAILTSADYSLYSDETEKFLNQNIAKSIQVGFAPIKVNLLLDNKGRHWATTGLQMSWANYTFSNDITVIDDNGVLMPEPLDESIKRE